MGIDTDTGVEQWQCFAGIPMWLATAAKWNAFFAIAGFSIFIGKPDWFFTACGGHCTA